MFLGRALRGGLKSLKRIQLDELFFVILFVLENFTIDLGGRLDITCLVLYKDFTEWWLHWFI